MRKNHDGAHSIPSTRDHTKSAKKRIPRHDPWVVGIFCFSFVLLLITSVHLGTIVGLVGDEPWYLLQGYSLAHFQTVDMARSIHDPHIYRQFFSTSALDDHTADFRGNGVRVVAYLPGYALFVGPLYATGGRFLILELQAAATALTATLIFAEARRLFHSHVSAIFATLTYLIALPTILYTAEAVPTTLATLVAFASFLLVVRALPAARGWRFVCISLIITTLAVVLPWLHIKYALVSLIISATELSILLRRVKYGTGPTTGLHDTVHQTGIADEAAATTLSELRFAWGGILLTIGATLINAALIAVYSHHYFGSWYPQYRSQVAGSFTSPNPMQLLLLYHHMFLDAQTGLFPWAPLLLLTPIGMVALWRRDSRYTALLLLWIAGLLGAFLSAAVAPYVNEAFAFPARFTVECLPYFALCVAALFTKGYFALPLSARRIYQSTVQGRMGIALAACCIGLLGVDAWFTLVGQLFPLLLLPWHANAQLAAAYPQILPQWWFALFTAR